VLVEVIERQEAAVDGELRGLLDEHCDVVEARLAALEVIPSKLRSVYTEAESFSSEMHTSSHIASHLSTTISGVSALLSRLQDVIQFFDDIVDTKTCAAGVRQALSVDDFESAASHIHRYTTIDHSIVENQTGTEEMRVEHEKMMDKMESRLRDAIIKKNGQQVLRFCKLYLPIGMAMQGTLRYCEWVADKLVKNCTEKIDGLTAQIGGKKNL